MSRSIVYSLLCVALLAAVQITGPSGRGLFGAGSETQIWCLLSIWVSALGLLLCAGLCVAAGRRRSVHPLVPLAFPLVSLLVSAAGWVVKAGEVGDFDENAIASYAERLLALGVQAWHAIEIPAVGSFWAGAAFIGAFLVAGCHRHDEGAETKTDRARWIWSGMAILAALGAAAAAVIIAGSFVMVSYALDPDIQPWRPSFEPLFTFPSRPLQLSLVAMLLVPATVIPVGLLGPKEDQRLARSRLLAAAALLGAVVTLSFAGPLWIAALRQEAMAITEFEPPFVWLGLRTNVSYADWDLLLVVTRAISIATAAIIAVATLLRTSAGLLAKIVPTVLVVLTLLGLLGAGALADDRIEEGVGGPCVDDCTCRYVVVARALAVEIPTPAQMDSCELWHQCIPAYRATEVIGSAELGLPLVEANECPNTATTIALTKNAILVDDRRVVDLRDGQVDPSNKRDGALGYFIDPLFDALSEAAENQELIASRSSNVEFRGDATVFMDRETRARTVDEVIYTGKKAGYRSLRFLVASPEITDRSPYRVVPVEAGKIVKVDPGQREFGRDGCHELLVIKARPIEGICAGTYEAGGCVGVAVAGEARCSAASSELSAELWKLSLAETQLELTSPSNEVLRAETATELADQLRRRSKGRAAVRMLALERPAELPYAEELRARSALVTPDLFAAAVLAGHMMPNGTTPVRGDNELSVLMGTRVGDSLGYGGPDPTARVLAQLMGAEFPRRLSEPPPITTGDAEIRGSLSSETIRRHVRRHILDIRYCYESEWARDQTLSGRVEIRFVIAPSGAVSSSSVTASTLGNPTAEQCIARAVQRIEFPAPDGGGVVIVTYPFRFEPVN